MSAAPATGSKFDVYIYRTGDRRGPDADPVRTADGSTSRRAIRRRRDRAAANLRRKAAAYLAQAGELRKLVAHLSEPEYLLAPGVLPHFESILPRLTSVYRISDRIRGGLREGGVPAGIAGLEFLLKVVKSLTRQIETTLALARLETGRCRRRAAVFDLRRALAEAARTGRAHYLAGEVGITLNPHGRPLRIRGKRPLWLLAIVDLICRAAELSPRKGVAARLRPVSRNRVRLTLTPRGALLSPGERRVRSHREQLLGAASPDGDPSFEVIRTLIREMGGRLTIGPETESCVLPLFTLELPTSPPSPREED